MIKDDKRFLNINNSKNSLIQEILSCCDAYLASYDERQDMLYNCNGLCWPYSM